MCHDGIGHAEQRTREVMGEVRRVESAVRAEGRESRERLGDVVRDLKTVGLLSSLLSEYASISLHLASADPSQPYR